MAMEAIARQDTQDEARTPQERWDDAMSRLTAASEAVRGILATLNYQTRLSGPITEDIQGLIGQGVAIGHDMDSQIGDLIDAYEDAIRAKG